jgi:hypothetical protein
MQIIVDIAEGEGGRPVGTIRAETSPEVRSFSGNLEFLALIEALYRDNVDAHPVGESSDLDQMEES